jgi:hypothetical protein
MFGMFQSVTTKSKPPGLELLQRDRAVLGLVDVGEAQFLEQIAHDAAHGREIVDHENFILGSAIL